MNKNTAAPIIPAPAFSLLDIVSYEDRANPRTVYAVIDITTSTWGTAYTLRNIESGEVVTSDLRQHGWKFATLEWTR